MKRSELIKLLTKMAPEDWDPEIWAMVDYNRNYNVLDVIGATDPRDPLWLFIRKEV